MPRARYTLRTEQNPGTIRADQKSHWKFPLPRKNEPVRFLFTAPRAVKYAIIRGPGAQASHAATYDERFRAQLDKCSLSAAQCVLTPDTEVPPALSSLDYDSMQAKLQLAYDSKVHLVILLLKAYDVSAYRNFKDLSDRMFGMHSICMTVKKGPENVLQETMTNIMMKMNLKMGGVNHGVIEVGTVLKNTMVIGGDLVHPGTGAFPGTPSIAAIVGSIDPFGGKCLGSLRLQNVHKTDREVRELTFFLSRC